MERPKCAIDGCNNGALIMFAGKLICGECFSKYYYQTQKQKWEELNNAINPNSGNGQNT